MFTSFFKKDIRITDSIWCECGSCTFENECETIFICALLPLPTFAKDTQITCNLLMNVRASPSLLKVGTSPPVKAIASLLMWSVISSELALLQHGGSRSVGKTSVKGMRGSVYLSLLVGHDSHFDLSADQLLDRVAGSRSHKVTVSATKGLA